MNHFANFEKKAAALGLNAEEYNAIAQETINFVSKVAAEQEKAAEASISNYAEGFCKTALEVGFDIETTTELYKVAETVKEAKGLPPALRAYLDKKRAEKHQVKENISTPTFSHAPAKIEEPVKVASDAYTTSFLKTAQERGCSEKQANEMLQQLIQQIQAHPELAGVLGGGAAGAGAGALAGGEGKRGKGALMGGLAGAGLGGAAGYGYRAGGDMRQEDLKKMIDRSDQLGGMSTVDQANPVIGGLLDEGNYHALLRHALPLGNRFGQASLNHAPRASSERITELATHDPEAMQQVQQHNPKIMEYIKQLQQGNK